MRLEQFWPWEPFPRGVRECLLGTDAKTGDHLVEWRYGPPGNDVPICPGDYVLTENGRSRVVSRAWVEQRTSRPKH